MSSSTRRPWAWRALGICLLGVASFFSTRSFYLWANRQTTEFSVGEEGYTFDPINVAAGTTNSPSLPGFTPTSVPAPMPSMPQGGNRLPRAQGQKPLASPPGSLPGFVAPSAQGFPHSLQPQYVGAIGQRQPELSSETGRLLSQLRKLTNKDSDEGKQLKKELRQSLEREFDRKHQQHQQMIADLEEQLERARQLYKKREENKAEIVDRRTAQLLGQADDLAWDLTESQRPQKANNQQPTGALPMAMQDVPQLPQGFDKTFVNFSCKSKDALLVVDYLKTQFFGVEEIEFIATLDTNTISILMDSKLVHSDLPDRIRNMINALDQSQFQGNQNLRNDLVDLNSKTLNRPVSLGNLQPSQNSFTPVQPANPLNALSDGVPQTLPDLGQLQRDVPRIDSTPSPQPPAPRLRLTMESERRIEVKLLPNSSSAASIKAYFPLSKLKDGLQGFKAGDVQNVEILVSANAGMDTISNLVFQVQSIRPVTIQVKRIQPTKLPLTELTPLGNEVADKASRENLVIPSDEHRLPTLNPEYNQLRPDGIDSALNEPTPAPAQGEERSTSEVLEKHDIDQEQSSDNLNPTNATPLPNSTAAFPSQPSGGNFSQYQPSPPLNDPNRVRPKVNQLQPNTLTPQNMIDSPNSDQSWIPPFNIPRPPSAHDDEVQTLRLTVVGEDRIGVELLPNRLSTKPVVPEFSMSKLSQHLQKIKPGQVDVVHIIVRDHSQIKIVPDLTEKVRFLQPELIASNITKFGDTAEERSEPTPTIANEPIPPSTSELPGPTENETSPVDSPDVQPAEKTADDQPASDQNQDPLTPPSSSDGEETPEE